MIESQGERIISGVQRDKGQPSATSALPGGCITENQVRLGLRGKSREAKPPHQAQVS